MKTRLCSRPEPQKAALPAKLISYIYFTRKINEVKKKDADKITDVSLTMASESPQRSEETPITEKIEDNGRKKLRLEKAYSHADYRSIEIVSNKTSSVDLISFYVSKKHNKKGSQSVPPATQGSFSGGARLPNSSVPQNTQSVNNNDMQNEKKDSSLQIEADNKTKYSHQLMNDTWNDIRIQA